MLQIQPVYSNRNEWMDLAIEKTLRFEVLEFSSIYLNIPIQRKIIEWYKKSGLVDSIHGAFMDTYPLSPDYKVMEISRKRCETSCEQAQKLGAKNVIFHSTALPFVRGGLEKLWANDASEYYQMLAAKYNLNIFIENFNDVDYVPLKLMMEKVTDERVGICLDVAHANYSRKPVREWFDVLGDYIGYLHLSDNEGDWDNHIPLGSGTTDIESAYEWLKRSNRNIPVTIEMKTVETVRQSYDYLEKTGMLDAFR